MILVWQKNQVTTEVFVYSEQPMDLLWIKIPTRSLYGACGYMFFVGFQKSGEAEICHLRIVLFGEEDIARLHVSVNY